MTTFTNNITLEFSDPFYSGGVTFNIGEVPYRFPMALDSRPYILDLESGLFRRYSIPIRAEQQDTKDEPGEQSLSREDLWRRTADDWSLGAGQTWYDRPTSSRRRFRSSKGVDVWTKYQLSLLPDTDQKRSSANTNLYMVPAGSRLYITDGNAILFTTDVTADTPTFTNVTGVPAGNPTSITSDGFNVYTSHTGNGIYKTDTGISTTASHITGTVTLVRYVKGRLMAANANSIYNPTAAGALPTALFTHANTNFSWVDFAEGPRHIFAAGYSGDKSLIYATKVKADGTGLDAPEVAGELPDGEIVRAIHGYLGFLVIGSDLGVRFAEIDADGKLLIGSLIATTSAVKCFEPQDRFVWFGWTNYDSTSTGLGRLDLSAFTAPFTPAYASDLMVTAQGEVQAVVTFQEIRVLSVSGSGFWGQHTNKVASGTLDSGLITYGIADTKIAIALDVKHRGTLAGTHTAHLSTDEASFVALGTHSSTSVEDAFSCSEARGTVFEVRTEMARSSSDNTDGPEISIVTLKSHPVPQRGEVIILPILLASNMTWMDAEFDLDIQDELTALRDMEASRRLVTLQLADEALSVIVEEVDQRPHSVSEDKRSFNSLVVIKAKRFSGG